VLDKRLEFIRKLGEQAARESLTLRNVIVALEAGYYSEMLSKHGNAVKAADAAGCHRNTIYKKVKE